MPAHFSNYLTWYIKDSKCHFFGQPDVNPPPLHYLGKSPKTNRFSRIQRTFSTLLVIIASRNGQCNMTSPLIYHMLNYYIWMSPE